MHTEPAEIVREYGPFEGTDRVAGVTHDGRQVWAATGSALVAFDPATGTATLLVRRWDGLDWAVLFNQRQDGGKLNDSAIDPALHRAAAEVKDWPKEDLFPQFRD